jgi:hypothetical protein
MVNFNTIDETQSTTSVKTEKTSDKKINPKYGPMSGLWVFGGINRHKKPMNDLYLIQPHYGRNIKYITRTNGAYKK